jgi:hypothetical protein
MSDELGTAPIEVQLLGPVRICSPAGGVLKLTISEAAVLTLLAASPMPASRSDLIDACAISEQTFRPLLSKLPRKLGLAGSIHRPAQRLPGMIERDPAAVITDVDRLRAELEVAEPGDRPALRRALRLLRGPAFGGLSYVRPNRAVDIAYGSVDDLVMELKRRAARSDLLDGGADGWLIDLCPDSEPQPAELRLAQLLQIIHQVGPGSARSILDRLDNAPETFAAPPVWLQTDLVARLLVASSTAQPARPAMASGHSGRLRSGPITQAAARVTSHLADPGCRLVLVDGPAGIGKSHLLDVLAADASGGTASAAGSAESGQDGGVRPVVRGQSLADRGASDVLAQLAAAPAQQLARRLDRRLDLLAALLVELLEGDPATAQPIGHYRRAVRTVAELLTVACPDGVLLMIDDVHINSPDLEHLLDDLVRLTPAGVKVVASVCSADLDPASSWSLARGTSLRRVEVARLNRHDAEELLGHDAAPIKGPIEQMLARTEGRPLGLLIQSDSRPEAGLAAHLRAAIAARPRAAQLTLAVLALGATDLAVDPELAGVLLSEAHLSWDLLGPEVTNDEILVGWPDQPRFGHRLWIEALEPVLLTHQRRALHLAAYQHLRSRPDCPAAHRTILARHALGAGPALDRAEVLTAVIEAATAAASNRDYISSRRLTSDALRHQWDPAQRLELVAQRAAVNRLGGWWDDALPDYQTAIEAALSADDDRKPAELVLEMAQAAWDTGPSNLIEELLVRAQRRLPATERLLSDRLDLCRAGGLDQDGSAGADRVGRDRILAAREAVAAELHGNELALSLLHGRQALLDVDPPERSLDLARRLADAGGEDVLLRAHGLQAAFVDLIRLDRRAEAGAALRDLRDLARTPVSATQAFGFLNCQNCWDLHLGRYDRVRQTMAEMSEFGSRLGGATFDQILLGQQFWLARDAADMATLRSYAAGAHALHEGDPATLIWAAAEALLLVDIGANAEALDVVVELYQQPGRLAALPRGPHRLATLAMLSEVVGRLHSTATLPPGLASGLYQGLRADSQAGVLAGWPTVFLGPVERFLGYSAAASGQPAVARSHLGAAVRADRHSPALLVRSIDALLALGGAGASDGSGDGGREAGLPVEILQQARDHLVKRLHRRL